MRTFLLKAIRFYQRYLSPYKGFCCAYRFHTGRASCSALGYRAVRRHGAVAGLVMLRERMFLCGVAHRRYAPTPVKPRPHIKQRGDCDLGCDAGGCDGCDVPSGKGLGKLCDLASCCDGGSCDWPERKRKNRKREKSVHIPPKVIDLP